MKAHGARNLAQGLKIPSCRDEGHTARLLRVPALPTFLVLWWYSFTKKAPASPQEKTHLRFLLHISKWFGSLVVKSRAYDWHICFSIDTMGNSPEPQEAWPCEKPLMSCNMILKRTSYYTPSLKRNSQYQNFLYPQRSFPWYIKSLAPLWLLWNVVLFLLDGSLQGNYDA